LAAGFNENHADVVIFSESTKLNPNKNKTVFQQVMQSINDNVDEVFFVKEEKKIVFKVLKEKNSF